MNLTISSAALLARCQQEIAESPAREVWGKNVSKGSCTLLVGETCVGKTVLLHRWAHSMATGAAFLGLTPRRPMKVLYLDVESPIDVFYDHLSLIGTHENLIFIDEKKWGQVPHRC
jgi:hypothetical protein